MTGNTRFNTKKMPLRVQVLLGFHSPAVLFLILKFLKEKVTESEFLSLRLVSRHLVNSIPDYLKSERINTGIKNYRTVLLKSLTPRSFYETSQNFDPSAKLTELQKLVWKERALQAAHRRWLITRADLMKKLKHLAEERKAIKKFKKYKKETADDFPEL